MGAITARGAAGIPEVRRGDDVAALVAAAALAGELAGDRLVTIAHTIVSKAEGAVVELAGIEAGERAQALASEHGKDARVMQVVLDESAELLRARHGVVISRTHHGFVCANAGVDASNAGADGTVVLLPRDPDASARRIRARLRELGGGAAPAVLVSDTFGRAWRLGQTDVAIGVAGLAPLDDWRERTDADGRPLRATVLAIADAAAAAADLARSKDSREPVVFVQGLARFVSEHDGPGAQALLRPLDEDLFS